MEFCLSNHLFGYVYMCMFGWLIGWTELCERLCGHDKKKETCYEVWC